ncbi:hypothetical protein HRH25_02430 [Flavisolibacter sp. BT320]|nr:hypothetical protein [Flavisolibacter longurius]
MGFGLRERLRTGAVAGTADIEIKANIKGRRQVSKNKQAATAFRRAFAGKSVGQPVCRKKRLLSTENGAALVARISPEQRRHYHLPTTAQAIG